MRPAATAKVARPGLDWYACFNPSMDETIVVLVSALTSSQMSLTISLILLGLSVSDFIVSNKDKETHINIYGKIFERYYKSVKIITI